MAAIAITSMTGSGSRAITETTLGSSDTITYHASANPILVIENTTVGAITPTIDGAGSTTVPVAGIGDVNVASGYAVPSIASGVSVAIPLKSISAYLKGVVTMTGASGAKAYILEF